MEVAEIQVLTILLSYSINKFLYLKIASQWTHLISGVIRLSYVCHTFIIRLYTESLLTKTCWFFFFFFFLLFVLFLSWNKLGSWFVAFAFL